MLSMESSCFICGETIPKSHSSPCENVENLKLLLTDLCQLLSVPNIEDNDWDFVSGLQQSICCFPCYDLLRNVGRVREIIKKTERQLKTYLSHVESLVVKSEAQDLQNSLWSPSCFVFRRQIIKNVKDSNENISGDLSPLPRVSIKEECDDFEPTNDDDHLEDDRCWNSVGLDSLDDFVDDEQLATEYISTKVNENNNDIKFLDIHVKSESSGESEDMVSDVEFTIKANPKKTTNAKSKTEIKTRPAQKRKFEISEDEATDFVTTKRRTSPRVAKKHANKALKQYASSDEEGDNPSQDKSFELNDKNVPVETEESEKDDDEDHKSRSKRKGKKQKRGLTPNLGARAFYPFVVADENLYLFKWGTFVSFNYTHLQCKAHNCNFEVPWDYYPSFQVMKGHIDNNHRTRKHRQQTPHPCLLCKTVYRCQEEFRKHIKKAHDQFELSRAKAVCECCLTYTRHSYARTHLFTHKNEAEKAAARETMDGSMRSFRPKESEITEKKWVCDYENCTSSFKSSRNLKRHKQTHIERSLRTDQTICPECGQQILRECLATHMKRVHHPAMDHRVAICPICDKRFLAGDKAMLEKHIRLHKGDKPFLCTQCGRSYVGSAELTAHVNDAHREDGPFPCEWCDQIYTRYRSLQSHKKRKHPDKYVKKPSLKKKSKFYYKEEGTKADFIGPIQRFPCSICGTICKYRSTLKKHMRNIHNTDTGARDETRKVNRVQKGAPSRTPLNDEGLAGEAAQV